jgi:hypothetical protein
MSREGFEQLLMSAFVQVDFLPDFWAVEVVIDDTVTPLLFFRIFRS